MAVSKQFSQDDGPHPALNVQQLSLLLRDLESLPTLPSVAAEVLELLADGAAEPGSAGCKKLRAIVRGDFALAARVLSAAGRRGADGVCTIDAAMERLGARVGLSLLPLAVLTESIGPQAAGAFGWPALWAHCQAVAAAAETIARHLPLEDDPGEAYTAGLLHDVGKLALACCFPKSYVRALKSAAKHGAGLAEWERTIIGADHTVAGRRLAEQWRLPAKVAEVIWLHHQSPESLPAAVSSPELIAVVGLADAMVRREEIGDSGNCEMPGDIPEMAAWLGLGEVALKNIVEAVRAEMAKRTAPSDPAASAAGERCRRARDRANAWLARQCRALAEKVDALETQARAFEHLHAFLGRLAEDATISDVLTQIGQVVGSAGGGDGGAIVVYSTPQPGEPVLALRVDAPNSPAWRMVPSRSELDAASPPAPTASPGEVFEGLLADPDALADWIDEGAVRHLPLATPGRWVGGVFYPEELADQPAAARLLDSLAGTLALALSVAQGQSRAILLGEQLAGANQVLAEAQRALTEARAMASVGEMAAGAAHELNNPLAVIAGRAQWLAQRSDQEDIRKTSDQLTRQAQRMSEMITELMDFASPPKPNPQAVEVKALFGEAARKFAALDDPQATAAKVDIQVNEPALSVWADRSQVLSAVLAAMDNAAEAGGDRARIALTAEVDEVSGSVLLVIEDDGSGMDAETLAQAFTPFFSRLPAGRRRGMGLSRARRYIENNAGRMWLRSRPDEGTTVTIELPSAES